MPSSAPHADAVVLDNATWQALTGPHASFAIGGDLARRYPDDVAPFIAVKSWDEPAVWDALIDLVGRGADIGVAGFAGVLASGWELDGHTPGVQLVETTDLAPRLDDEAVDLAADDVADMLALVDRNRPGPFRTRTIDLGRYRGIRRDGRLIAMAGERLRLPGWTEISAVAVDDDFRRQGLASRLVLDIAFHVQHRGDRAFMHAAAENVGAIAAYEKLGFARRRTIEFGTLHAPS